MGCPNCLDLLAIYLAGINSFYCTEANRAQKMATPSRKLRHNAKASLTDLTNARGRGGVEGGGIENIFFMFYHVLKGFVKVM